MRMENIMEKFLAGLLSIPFVIAFAIYKKVFKNNSWI